MLALSLAETCTSTKSMAYTLTSAADGKTCCRGGRNYYTACTSSRCQIECSTRNAYIKGKHGIHSSLWCWRKYLLTCSCYHTARTPHTMSNKVPPFYSFLNGEHGMHSHWCCWMTCPQRNLSGETCRTCNFFVIKSFFSTHMKALFKQAIMSHETSKNACSL